MVVGGESTENKAVGLVELSFDAKCDYIPKPTIAGPQPTVKMQHIPIAEPRKAQLYPYMEILEVAKNIKTPE